MEHYEQNTCVSHFRRGKECADSQGLFEVQLFSVLNRVKRSREKKELAGFGKMRIRGLVKFEFSISRAQWLRRAAVQFLKHALSLRREKFFALDCSEHVSAITFFRNHLFQNWLLDSWSLKSLKKIALPCFFAGHTKSKYCQAASSCPV